MKSQRRADSANIIASLVIGGGIFTCLFLAFSWGNSLLRQAAIEQNLTAFYRENARLEKENEEFLQRFRYLGIGAIPGQMGKRKQRARQTW
jgi:hypothetical protein